MFIFFKLLIISIDAIQSFMIMFKSDVYMYVNGILVQSIRKFVQFSSLCLFTFPTTMCSDIYLENWNGIALVSIKAFNNRIRFRLA